MVPPGEVWGGGGVRVSVRDVDEVGEEERQLLAEKVQALEVLP